MNFFRNVIPVIILVFFFPATGHAQNLQIPGKILQHLQQQCSICRQQPADSLRLLTAPAKNYAISFHNSLVSLKLEYLDEAYTHILHCLADMSPNRNTTLYQYAGFIKAKVLYYKNLYNESLTACRQLLQLPVTDTLLMANIHANISEIYLEQGLFKEALDNYAMWEKLFLPGADAASITKFYHNKALSLFHLGYFAEAETSFFRNLQLVQQAHDSLGLALVHMNLGNLYYEQYQDNKAIANFKKSLFFAQRADNLYMLKNAYLNMAVVEENRKQYTAALEYRKQYEALQDSTWNRDKVWDLAAQERKFSQQLNENKILMLEQQDRLSKAELFTKSRQRNTLLAAAVGLLVLSGVIYYAYRAKVKSNRIIAQQKEALDQLNRTKDKLYSIVAHDLRSPVSSLKTNLAMLQASLPDNASTETKSTAAAISKTVNNTYTLLDNLLHWALSQTNQLFFRPEKLHLLSVINQVCYDYEPVAAAKGIPLQKNIPASLFITADLNTTKIIFRNLLDNAIKYTHQQGSITIMMADVPMAGVSTSHHCIQITDTGIGMDEATLQAIEANNGQQVQKDTQGKSSTGLGLGLCKTLAEKNNGKLEISSRPGKGASISIYLPV